VNVCHIADFIEGEKSWKILLQNLPIGVLTMNKDQEISFANDAACKVLEESFKPDTDSDILKKKFFGCIAELS